MADEAFVERRGNVQLITINRPEARNALNRAVAEVIRDAVDELDASDDLQVGVITGAGGNFSAGMDLKAFMTGEHPMFEGRGLCGISQTPPKKPLIAAVEGYALAAGFELVLACDLVIAGKSAQFGIPEVKRGLVAAGGGAVITPQRIPLAVAMELILTGDPMPATRAAEVGLITRVVEDGRAVDAALGLAGRIAENGPLAVQASKLIARKALEWTGEKAWTEPAAVFMPVFQSEDAKEGPRAFAEKRKPVWKGR
ncbi:MAG TPA: crotonase/enoyl-CoA hydratase family protein [Jatrophihabitans sp.]|jgi:enoyl-CoA hydratase